MGFKPATERPQTYALYRTATRIVRIWNDKNKSLHMKKQTNLTYFTLNAEDVKYFWLGITRMKSPALKSYGNSRLSTLTITTKCSKASEKRISTQPFPTVYNCALWCNYITMWKTSAYYIMYWFLGNILGRRKLKAVGASPPHPQTPSKICPPMRNSHYPTAHSTFSQNITLSMYVWQYSVLNFK